jgi:general L-amino acid transport system substrate-binding protein
LRICIVLFSLAVLFWTSPTALAGTLDRIKSEGIVRCGGQARPGLAEIGLNGRWSGLTVDICHALAVAVLGPQGRFEFRDYDTPKEYDAVRNGEDEVFFLTASPLIEGEFPGKLIPGPVVYYESHGLLVPETSNVRRLEDLSGGKICFLIGSGAQRSVEAFFQSKNLAFLRLSYSEEGEMTDAYKARRCEALAGETTTLASTRLERSISNLSSRLLTEPLETFPIMAMTGTDDGRWAAIVAWTVHTLLRAEVREGSWRADGVQALRLEAPELGLSANWQQNVLAAVGSYGDIFRRNLGGDSRYKLVRGANGFWKQGGLMLAPYSE